MTRSVSKEMLIEDIIESYPETIGPMQEMGVRCIRCGEPVWGTVEENAKQKNLKNIDEIVERLNEVIRKNAERGNETTGE